MKEKHAPTKRDDRVDESSEKATQIAEAIILNDNEAEKEGMMPNLKKEVLLYAVAHLAEMRNEVSVCGTEEEKDDERLCSPDELGYPFEEEIYAGGKKV